MLIPKQRKKLNGMEFHAKVVVVCKNLICNVLIINLEKC